MLIKKSDAKVVDLGTKKILKYTSPDSRLELNRMTIDGRHPNDPNHYIYEVGVDFMVYGIKGKGIIYVDAERYEIGAEDAVYVPRNSKFAAEGQDFEYLTVESPAWYPEQAFIVDSEGNNINE